MPEFKKAGEYDELEASSIPVEGPKPEGGITTMRANVQGNNLNLEPPAIDITDEEAERWFRQIENFENAKNGAKLAKEAIEKKYPEEKYLELSKNGRIDVRISGLFELKYTHTLTKANLKPKPILEKETTQLVIKPLKRKKDASPNP